LLAELRAWPRILGIVSALLFLGVVHGTLLVYFYSVGARFTFPALAIMTVLGLSGLAAAARRVAGPASTLLLRTWPRWATLRAYAGGVASGVLGALLVIFAIVRAPALAAWQQQDAGVAPGFRASPMEGVGGWVRRNLPPDAVIMARQPWELRFYVPEGVKTVAMPWTVDAREALGIAHHYGVTHVLADPARPALSAYLAALGPGIHKVDPARPLYAIDWAALPPGDVVLPHRDGDARAASTAAGG
jgi:hypothetical protein